MTQLDIQGHQFEGHGRGRRGPAVARVPEPKGVKDRAGTQVINVGRAAVRGACGEMPLYHARQEIRHDGAVLAAEEAGVLPSQKLPAMQGYERQERGLVWRVPEPYERGGRCVGGHDALDV